jgi:putative membrane protein
MTTSAAAAGQRQRLHPLTPLLRGAKILAATIAAISWQGYAQLGFLGWALTVVIVLVAGVALAAVSWAVTGYEVVGRELRVSEGLLWRRTRAIPLERLQAVDVVRPVLARLAGLAELRLEVIGGGRTEAPLAYLKIEDAVRLRERLLALARASAASGRGGAEFAVKRPEPGGTASAPVAAGPATAAADQPAADQPAADQPAAAPERLIHTVNNRDVVVGQLLTPHAWFLPLAVLLTLLPFAEHPQLSFIAVASMVTAVIGVVQVPARRVLAEWNFRIGADADGLRLRHGLLDTRSQTVPPQRVQAITLTWPLLWRPLGWLHARFDVAGYGAQSGAAGIRTGTLLPVADLPTARRVVAEVLDGVDVASFELRPAPAQARWLAPLAQPNLAVALTDAVVAARDGWLRPQTVVVPLARIQSVRVVQGPLQRALRLATVHVDTAGALHAVIRHRDAREAYWLAETLASAARAARRRSQRRSASPTAASVNPTYAQPTNTSTM